MDRDIEPLVNHIISILKEGGFECYPAQSMPGTSDEITHFIRGKSLITLDVTMEADEETLKLIKQED